MRGWHVWAMRHGSVQVTMRHMLAETEMEAVVDMEDGELPEKIEPCDGSTFYCMSRGIPDITRWAKQSRNQEGVAGS